MNSLTCNLHLLMVPFYQPKPTRFKILIEQKPFPSDYHAVDSQLKFHGYNSTQGLIQVAPRNGECIDTKDILDILETQGNEIALVLIPGVQYYTGQCFDMKVICQAAKAQVFF